MEAKKFGGIELGMVPLNPAEGHGLFGYAFTR